MMTTHDGRLIQGWNAVWFSPESSLNLAAARVIFAVHALWILGSRDLPVLSDLPAGFWTFVPPTVRWRYLIWPGHGTLESYLQWVAIIALCAAVCGLWGRLACFVAGVLLYHLAPLETLIWTANPFERGFTISILALLTLSFSRCTDTLSIKSSRRVTSQPKRGPEYNWPLRLIQLFLCQIYLFSGYSKLFRAGWGWATSENIRAWLLVFSQQDQVIVFNTLGPWLAERPILCQGIAIGSLAIDFGFITVVFWKRSRFWLIPLVLLFHTSILLSMNIAFLNIPQLLIFIDWQALANRLNKARQQQEKGKDHNRHTRP